jgi:ATP-binding cassette subfamily C protein LapB
VILVTHKPQLLSAVQRLLVVVEGRITIDGPTSAVIAELKKRAASGRPNRQEV